jgi:hypothetical protein
VYGDIFYKYDKESNIIDQIIRTNKRNVRSPIYWVDSPAIYHQASFIKSDLFAELGGYKTIFKLANDTEFAMNAIFKNSATTKYINSVFAKFDASGISSSINNENTKIIVLQEHGRIIVDMFPRSYMQIYAKFVFRNRILLPYFLLKGLFSRVRGMGIKKSAGYYIKKYVIRGKKCQKSL